MNDTDVMAHAVYVERKRAQATNRPPTETEKRLVATVALHISGANTFTYPGWELDVAQYAQLRTLTAMSTQTSRRLRVQFKSAVARLVAKGLWCPLHRCVHLR